MSTFLLALIIGWLLGRYWDNVLSFVNEKKNTIQTKSSSNTSND